MDTKLAKKIALEAALEAGEILRGGINSHKNIGRKSSAVDLVTQYDRQAEAVIVNKLKKWFPDHKIVAEEGDWNDKGSDLSDFIWYIDPLDGTNNFSHGLPIFAVSIALFSHYFMIRKPLL